MSSQPTGLQPTSAPPPPPPPPYPPPAQVGPPPVIGAVREAYRVAPRVQAANVVARVAAVLLFLGLLGSAATWDAGKSGEESIFDLARSSFEVARPGPGYLVGPALILLALPVIRKGRPAFRYALTHRYRARVATASVLWLAGLATLIGGLASLSESYEVQDGAYIAGGLMVIGLLATLAQWPQGMRVIRVDNAGNPQGDAGVQKEMRT